MAAWYAANPNLRSGLISLADVQTAIEQSTENSIRRFRLNQWVRTQESWLPIGAWEACEGSSELEAAAPTWVAVDMALKHDSVAVVIAQPQRFEESVDRARKLDRMRSLLADAGKASGADASIIPDSALEAMMPEAHPRLVVRARIWKPAKAGAIDVAAVENHLRDLHRNLNVQAFAYDPAYFTRSAQILEDEGLPMIEWPQSAQRMVPACQTAYRIITDGTAEHDGDPEFADHILSAATRPTENGWRLSKGKSRRKIDAAIALAIAAHMAMTSIEEGPSVYESRGLRSVG
jgi:phage terminase large subunit-like protein